MTMATTREMRSVGARWLAVLLLPLIGGCVDLDVTNLNDPDRERAISSATDVEALISGGFQPWWQTSHHSYPASALSTAADAHSSSWGNWGMRDSGWEPRKSYNNDPSYSYNNMAESPWEFSYRSLAAVRDGLLAIEGGQRIQEGDGPDNTERTIVFGKFVQAMSLANLAVLFDKAFIVDETVEDVATLELQPYDQVWSTAEAKFGEVVNMASSGGFIIPSVWVGFNGDWSSDYMAEVARAFRARYRTQVARTSSEREAVDWNAVLADVSAGISKDFAGYCDCDNNWSWARAKHHTAHYSGWARIDYRTVGPADASGGWETWVNASADAKRPFDIDTDDRRITGGSPDTHGKYIRYLGNSPFPADRGIYHYSNYIDWRWRPLYENNWEGEYPDMTSKELEFLAAEANYRMGNKDAAMEVVNKYRTMNGELPPFADANAVAPGGDRCVPQLPSGACGTLWDALKYEKRIELFHYGFGTEYFDDRGWGDLVSDTWLQLPIPGSELEILLQEIYTFGGPGGESTAAALADDRTTRGLGLKRQAYDAWTEATMEPTMRDRTRRW